ncbi:unnamed protein product [Clavelina lepadiformis]|uniref:Uncharacterized protein n=1 Tax=Clavelina lepadiformis TaxID=159417 RepID=A0ABP0F8H4_CLALP
MAIDEPMTPHIFDKLTTCDPELAWELCRNYVGFQLLGKDAVTVPFLDEAYHYVPFGVIVKQKKRSSISGSKKSSYAIIGAMANVTAPQVDKTAFRQKPERVHEYTFNDR